MQYPTTICTRTFLCLVVSALLVVALAGCPHGWPARPRASFIVTPTAGAVPMDVAFTDTSSSGRCAITAWAWDFGDGETSSTQSPSHTYAVAGTYTVSLTVTAALGRDTATATVTALDVWYVTEGGAGDGSSWNEALGTIQEAVDAAGAAGGGDVWVAAGTYTSFNGCVVTMAENVHLYGGFVGIEKARDDRDWEANATIIDGECAHCCVIGASNATLDAFVVQHGSYSNGNGGGMSNYEGISPTVVHCTFQRNTAKSGGGMYNGMYSSPMVIGCTFIGNTADNGYDGDGGGMYSDEFSSPTLRDCVFIENLATGDGGGMYAAGAPVLSNCIFSENLAQSEGGGVYVAADSSPTLANCTLSGNSAGIGGHGAYNVGSLTAINCIFWANSGPAYSDEIHNGDGAAAAVTYSCVQGGYDGEGNIADDPLLMGTRDSTGRIRPDSPCIDAGTTEGAPDADIRGVARPQGTGYDIGAYELDDSDGDGISDAWEQAYFGDMTSAFAGSDSDEDGLTDLEECLYGSDPLVTDTDGDGISDGDEVARGWHPALVSGIRRVDVANTSSTQDGLSWATAFTSIQEAIDDSDALGECEVWVAAGTYTSLDGCVVTMAENVHLYGGFAGTEQARDERDWEANATIVDGESARRCVIGADDATLDGFIIQHGTPRHFDGGGMLNEYGASPTVANCTFSDNRSGRGGGMYNDRGSSPTVINCIFSDNVATYGEGGAMNNEFGSSPTVTNCTFTGNSADHGEGGGAIFSGDSSPAVTGCAFMGNTADYGGAISSWESLATFTNCVFAGNYGEEGGAMRNYRSPSLTLINCTFFGNKAAYGGAIRHFVGGSPAVTNCILWGDSATIRGAEIDNDIYPLPPCTPNMTYSCIEGGYEGEGNIADGPLFVDAANGDYSLQSGSPCIDTGTPDGAPETDILGVARPQGSGYDMGAHEYAGG